MLNVKLDDDLGSAVAKVAKRAKISRTAVVREAVLEYLENARDLRDIKSAKLESGRVVPLSEVKRRLGPIAFLSIRRH